MATKLVRNTTPVTVYSGTAEHVRVVNTGLKPITVLPRGTSLPPGREAVFSTDGAPVQARLQQAGFYGVLRIEEITEPVVDEAAPAAPATAPAPVTDLGIKVPTGHYLSQGFIFGSGGGVTVLAAYTSYVPVVVRGPATINQLRTNIATASATASVAMALYEADPATGLPGAVLAETAEISMSTTGWKNADVDVAVEAGLYYIGVRHVGTGGAPLGWSGAFWPSTSTVQPPYGVPDGGNTCLIRNGAADFPASPSGLIYSSYMFRAEARVA